MNPLLWHLLAGTRGGEMRQRILTELHKRPLNANQLTTLLKVDYKTVQHHLRIMQEHKIIFTQGKYAASNFIAPEILPELEEIWERTRKT